MATASTSHSNPQPEEQTRNWLELHPDVMASILHRVGPIDILTNVQYVCTPWLRICKDPAMWRSIDMLNLGDLCKDIEYGILEHMCMHAVDRSKGQLVDINIGRFGTDELLMHIYDRSSQLKRLQLVCCNHISTAGLSEAFKKLPLLEELHLYHANISKEVIVVAGHCCPLLKSFKLNNLRAPGIECDEDALAIAENMPELRHLQLLRNAMTSDGLQAILDGCPRLESLDVRQCLNVCLDRNLGRRCFQRIKDFRGPCDSTEDFGFYAEFMESDSFDDEDSGSGFTFEGLGDYYNFSGGSSDLSDYDDYYDRYSVDD